MSQYLVTGKGWRYDFTLRNERHTKGWFRTKTEAKGKEQERRRELRRKEPGGTEIRTDMPFLDLINRRLDHVKAYNAETYYRDYVYMAREWMAEWGELKCSETTRDIIQTYLANKKAKVSAYAANKHLRYLRAAFNYCIDNDYVNMKNPCTKLQFFKVEERVKYVPPKDDVIRVLDAAVKQEQRDYLTVVKETLGRIGEINRLTWDDVNFKTRFVVLYTRKTRTGDLKPRLVWMTDTLYNTLLRRSEERDKSKPWVFWHRYFSRKQKKWVEGPYKDRKGLMKALCKKAGVRYFRYHPLRHYGASVLDKARVPISSIQKILGHAKRSTTELYIQSINDADVEAMQRYEREEKSLTRFLTHGSVNG